MRLRFLSYLATGLLACGRAFALDQTADATAKFLAGLPINGTPLENYASASGWKTHAADLDRAWKQFDERQLAKIRDWAPQALGPAYQDNGPMYYMFSGPDFLYANAFFPNASTYILCGTEPVGAIPDITKMPQHVLPSALANLRKSLDSVLSWSFFITKNMKVDLRQQQLSGTLPLLYVFLARAGCTIESVGFCSARQRNDVRSEDHVHRTRGATANPLLFHNRPRGLGHKGHPELWEILRATRPGRHLAQSCLIPHALR